MSDLGVATKLRAAFELSPTILAVTTLEEGRLLEVNDAFLRATGYTREEIIGRLIPEIGLWANPGMRDEGLAGLRAGRPVRDIEARFRTKSGGEVVAIANADLVVVDGRTCVLTALIDITARVRAEAALRETERRFAQAWGESMVDYLAKGNFPTNGENIRTINEKFLPSRIVRPEDYGTKPTDLGPLQQRTVQALDAFHTIDKLGLNHLIGSNAAGVAGSIPWSRGKLLEMLDAAVKNPDQAEAIMEDIGQKVDRVRDLVPQFPDLEWPDWLRIPGVTPPSTTLSR